MRNLTNRFACVFAAAALLPAAYAAKKQPVRVVFHPPANRTLPEVPLITETLHLEPDPYGNEAKSVELRGLPGVDKPSELEFRLRQAEDWFSQGKAAYQAGRMDEARHLFNRAVDALLGPKDGNGAREVVPDSAAERARLERRMDQLVDAIFHYDLDRLGASESQDKVAYDKAPLDGILDLNLPVDPRLKQKVTEEVRATTSGLPLEEADAVTAYINFFSSERGKRVIAFGLKRAGRYAPMIQRILAEEGVPQELIYLAQAESGFLPRAVSYKKAVGMWQFVQFRGREYGLMQTPATDDRLDPEKATRAAARHLRDLYNEFGDWYLAIAAYNCGPGCVERAVARTGYADFFKLRSLGVLPKETTNYVPIIVAMTIMTKNAANYGLDNIIPDPPLEWETIKLSAPTHISLIADAVDTPLSGIRELNPALLKPVAPAGYEVHVPKGMRGALETMLALVPENKRATWRVHKISRGETLASIAKRYGTSAGSITAANRENAGAEAGEMLVIPAAYQTDKSFVPRPAPAASKTPARARRTGSAVASVKGKAPVRRTATAAKTHSAAAKKPGVRAAQPRPAARPGTVTTAALR